MTIRYNWGRLNSILAPFSLRYYDQSTTSWAGTLNRVLDNSFSADAFSAQGRIKAICLRVEATPFAPADSWVKQVYTDNEDSAKLWLSVKARIPELHSCLCDPFAIDVQREYKGEGIQGLIEMYPTFLSRFPLGENGFTSVPAAGEIIEVDFDDRKNFTNPTYIGRIGTANLVDGNPSASPGVANTFKESLNNADLRITDGETGTGTPGNSDLTTPVPTPTTRAPGAVFKAAAADTARGTRKKTENIVIHTVGLQGRGYVAINEFKKSGRKPATSTHFVIKKDGTVTQMHDLDTKTIHAKNINYKSIGIEHAAPGDPPTAYFWASEPGEKLLRSSAKLVSWLCEKYDIPKKRAFGVGRGIIGHSDVTGATHTDPGDFPWNKYIKMVNAEKKERID
jgi:N-acetyl-anhydromuramyl-L-alanine amidase AmpD